MQLKASFRKEVLAFVRTGKFLIIALSIVGWSIFSPLIFVGMAALFTTMEPLYNEMGMDITGFTDLLGDSTVSMGVSLGITNIAQVGLVVFLLLINSFAGGEQKKRSIIIPRSSGLRNFSYIFPKYIIFPVTALVLSIAGAFAALGISVLSYDVYDVTIAGVLLGGTLAGVYMMFYICCHLTLGTASGRPGMSAGVCVAASLLLPDIFSLSGSDFIYNPFTLHYLAGSLVHEGALLHFQPFDVLMTTLVTVVIIVILYFAALFVQNAQKVDNSGNEIRL